MLRPPFLGHLAPSPTQLLARGQLRPFTARGSHHGAWAGSQAAWAPGPARLVHSSTVPPVCTPQGCPSDRRPDGRVLLRSRPPGLRPAQDMLNLGGLWAPDPASALLPLRPTCTQMDADAWIQVDTQTHTWTHMMGNTDTITQIHGPHRPTCTRHTGGHVCMNAPPTKLGRFSCPSTHSPSVQSTWPRPLPSSCPQPHPVLDFLGHLHEWPVYSSSRSYPDPRHLRLASSMPGTKLGSCPIYSPQVAPQ